MKKLSKKLKLAKETLRNLEAETLEKAFGGAWVKTVDATACVTNCAACDFTNRPYTVCATC
jgi:hypothetical protein